MGHAAIVGAGPAGASLAYLLAHRGVAVTLIERRRDFAREFRGEVLMPSGVDALAQMGLMDALANVAAHTQERLGVYLNGRRVFEIELPVNAAHGVSFRAISQPALLENVVAEASKRPHFTFERGAAIRGLLTDRGRVTGLTIATPGGVRDLRADLVIGADGRNSTVRRSAGLEASSISPPMDIVWCKIPKPAGWRGVRAYAGRGHLLVAYHTWDDTLQLGWVILKGTFGELRERGIGQWVEEMANHVSPDLGAHLRAARDTVNRPFLLEAVSDCVRRWSAPGVLVIGDAAHTMSPVGGQGINIALRDAIVAANHLVPVLAIPTPSGERIDRALAAIEAERMPEVREIQTLQAQPPKVLLNRAWWAEPVRWIAGQLLASAAVRARIATRIAAFPFGVTEVRLNREPA